jgi:hypothetical protein
MLKPLVVFWPPASLTLTVKLYVPAVVGVPDNCPEVDKLKPAGTVPDATPHEYGVVPPLALSVAVYADPTCPEDNEFVLMTRAGTGAAATAMLKARVAVFEAESVTFALKL